MNKNNLLPLIISLSILNSCSTKPEQPSVADTVFEHKEGCFLLYNMKTNNFDQVIGKEMCEKSFPPFSTFKVPLAVIAFDSGVLKDANVVFKWDGVKESREEANRDHNAKTWMRDSIVWFSQRITEKLGKDQIQKYLDKFNYGNKDLSEGIKTAWITSPATGKGLKLTPYEQAEFMKKLWKNELPVSRRSMRITQEITFLELSPNGFQLSGKTGSNFFDSERKIRMGWFVSHLRKGDQEFITVTNFRDLVPTSEMEYGGAKAKEITKKLLSEKSLW